MKIYTNLEKQLSPLCVALGYFDGVHKGHQRVIKYTVELKKYGMIPTVFTFSQNPKAIISKVPEHRITDEKTKEKVLESMGIELIYKVDFNDLRNLTAENFVKDILHEVLNAKYVVCGFNYHFGKNGIADAGTLKKLCLDYGIKTKIVRPALYKHEPISSTRIRNALLNNDSESASKMLNFRKE